MAKDLPAQKDSSTDSEVKHGEILGPDEDLQFDDLAPDEAVSSAIEGLKAGSLVDILHVVATAKRRPIVEIVACLLRIDEAAQPLLALLERAASGARLSEDEATLLFRGLHILAGGRATETFAPLLRLLRIPEDDLEDLLGDAVTQTLQRIVASVFDGDVDALLQAIADKSIDEYARSALLDAAIFLTFDRKIDGERMAAFLQRFHEERLAADGDMIWAMFVQGIALLGLRPLAGLAEEVISERMPDGYTTIKDFRDDLAVAERAPDDAERFREFGLGYIEDVNDELAWADPSEYSGLDESDDDLSSSDWQPPGRFAVSEPVTNPFRHVGRNDPCPCGSGKKAKRCCLAAA